MNIFAQRTWYNRHIVGQPSLLTHDGRNPACIYYLKLAGNVFRTFEPAKIHFVQSLGRIARRSEPYNKPPKFIIVQGAVERVVSRKLSALRSEPNVSVVPK